MRFRYPHKRKVILYNGRIVDFSKGDFETDDKDLIDGLKRLKKVKEVKTEKPKSKQSKK